MRKTRVAVGCRARREDRQECQEFPSPNLARRTGIKHAAMHAKAACGSGHHFASCAKQSARKSGRQEGMMRMRQKN